MDRIAPAEVANAILAAPGWARVGITMPDARLRAEAANELARAILTGLGEVPVRDDEDQMKLSL